ncbi:hypothetical protein C0Q70_20826 [Pomacea canaliculata]|uniref:Ig-like domain-containing protein n=1 Tax=Pomacea canaliculata TaxID=400727 RepID=A0A2T7NAS7_POMCA|nr:hypothetical protein C0Q70_20826 [Pomacea canaliculata]
MVEAGRGVPITLTIVVLVAGSNAVLWSSSPHSILACDGHEVTIPWSFTLIPNETVISITWFVERNDGTKNLFSSLTEGEFFSPSRQHVQFVPNAGLRLQNVTDSDTGVYSVHVSTLDGAGHVTISNRSAAVQVTAPPVLSGGQFLARHRSAPEKDDVTGVWHVILECGQFTDRGRPPVTVQWRTPSGAVYTNVNYREASSALVWSSSPEVKENITACAGDDVSIPWSFTTSPTETVIGITWFLERHDGIRTILSSIIDGEFFSLSRQHVQLVPNAGVRLQNVTVRDTGLYSVHVSTSDDAGHVTINNRSAAVEISAPPVLSDGQFLARRRAAPARDDVTGTWHVVLECGQFTDRGQPPINVQWTSPSGTVHTDVNYQDGYFLLPLQAVETGNYTCSLTGSSPARRCLASDSILLRETAVYVDDENVKWTVMEANQREFIEKEERLRQENEALKSQVQNLTQRLHQLQDAIDIENTPSGQASCADIQQQYSMSGVYKLSVENVSMSVYCDLVTDGGGWTNLHILTSSRRVEMRVDLQAYDGTRAFVVYGNYTIGNSSTNYTFNYDTFQGEDAGNSLLIHKGHEFATQDHGSNAHCAVTYHGGWWFNDCLRSNLNGIYRPNATTPHADGIIWADFKMFETSLKRTEMKIRPLS